MAALPGTDEAEDPLRGADPSFVLSNLDKEEESLKGIKNVLMEELERVQLEEMLLQRQLDAIADEAKAAEAGPAVPQLPPPQQQQGSSLTDILGD